MKVLSIGDLHLPFHNKYYMRKLYKQIEKEQPDVVIQDGDLYDQYLFSRHDSNLNIITPDEELRRARKSAEYFWKRIQAIVPKAKCIQLLGNHDTRILRKAMRVFPEAYTIIHEAHNKLYTFENVETCYTDRDYVEYDGVVYCHGWMAKHHTHFKKSVVRAHDHKAWMYIKGETSTFKGAMTIGSSYKIKREEGLLFEISCGMYADESLLPFEYTSSKLNNWSPAISIVTKDYAELRIL